MLSKNDANFVSQKSLKQTEEPKRTGGGGFRVRPLLSLAVIAIFSLSIGAASSVSAQEQAPAAKASSEERIRADLESGQELYHSGNWYTAQEAFQNAYNAAGADSPLKAEAAFELSGVLWEQGDYANANKKINEAIQLAEKAKLVDAKGQLLLRKAYIDAARGNFGSALTTFGQCVDEADSVSDTESSALCRVAIFSIKRMQGKNPGSEKRYTQDLTVLKSTKKPMLVGVALAKIADLQQSAGQYANALALLQQAQGEFDKTQSVPAVTRNRLRLAELYQAMGQWTDASNILKDMDLTFKNMNNRPALVTTYLLKAQEKEHNGDGNGAYEDYKKALHYAAAIASPQLQAQTHLAICEFFSRTQDPEKGIQSCQMARSVFRNRNMKSLATRSLVGESRINHTIGKFKEAETLYRQSIAELEKLPNTKDKQQELLYQKTNLCQISTLQKNKSSIDDCKVALAAFDEVKTKNNTTKNMLLQTLVRLAIGEQEAKMNDSALAHLKRAIAFENDDVSKLEIANAYVSMGELQGASDPAAQMASYNKAIKLIDAMPQALTPNTLEGQLNVNAKTAVAQALLDQEKWSDAAAAFAKLIDVAGKVGALERKAWAYLGLAKAYQNQSRPDRAKIALSDGRAIAAEIGNKELIKTFDKYLHQ